MIEFNFEAYNSDCVIVGQKASGKSYLANVLLRGMQNLNVIVYDFNHQFHNSRAVVMNTIEDTFQVFDKMGGGQIIFQPFDKSQNTFNRFCSEIFQRHNIVVILDECHQYMSKMSIPKPYNDLILSGRPRGISVISISSRPQNLPSNTLTNARHIFAFHLGLESDLLYLQNWLGSQVWALIEPDQRPKRIREKIGDIPRAEQHTFFYRDTNANEGIFGKIG